MVLLGIDYGTVRVGLATLDTGVGFALPLRSIDAAPMRELASEIVVVATREGATQLVLGVPVAMGGGEAGEMAQTARRFAEVLREVSTIPVATEDERLTSAMVESARRQAGARKADVDKDAMAAALILETYASRHKLV